MMQLPFFVVSNSFFRFVMVEPVTINLRYFARDLGLPHEQVQAVVALLEDGFPVPFIARYRKDQTGNLDEETLRFVEDEFKSLRALCERKQAILKTIDSQGKLTPELDKKIRDAKTSKRLEDLYLPFKPKRQTLATDARERGLEPLALEILNGIVAPENLDQRASEFINEDKKVNSAADALLGAGYIIAEMFYEKLEVLQHVRNSVFKFGKIVTSKIETKVPVIEKSEKKSGSKRRERKKPVTTPEINSEVSSVSENLEGTETLVIENEPIPNSNSLSEAIEINDLAENAVSSEIAEVTDSADSSGSGGGDEIADSAVETVTELEPVATEIVAITEPSETEPIASLPDADVQMVTEQFQQWKEAQEEQGIPVVKSQNQQKKKKKEEIRKQREERRNKQQEHIEHQYSDYFNFTAGLRNFPAHRILAINRGERFKILRVKIENDETKILETIKDLCVPKDHPHTEFLTGCLQDALHRLAVPAMEREIRGEMTDFAEKQAVRVFGKNLRNLLLQPPLHRKRVLALDPGFRHGCKMVPLDEFGNVLDFQTVYLTETVGAERREKAIQIIAEMIRKYNISVIAIGNGSACRQTEEAVSDMIAKHFADTELAYIIVNEAGASVYSASAAAKEEFPNYDVLLRGAVSIGRRLQDPLNELVKIDPASLGVGMYQHDLKNKHLKDMLTEVVESCVNFVGVDLNTATPAILRYVAGLNQMTAKRIHEFRQEHGPFRSREDLKKVSGFGEVAFTHAAGFLKIHDGANPLDVTWIHPESYELAANILEKLGFSIDDLRSSEKIKEIAAKIASERIGELASRFAMEFGAGLFTVRDILENLSRPGRDPRESLPPPIFKKGILHAEDLKTGMELTGTVLNVVDFGAFVDIGLHESGLIHISQMADRFLQDAHERVSVGDIVRVWVVEADINRKRISLSMLPPGVERQPRPERRSEHRRRDQSGEEQSAEKKTTEQKPAEHRDHPPRRDDRRDSSKPQGQRPQSSGDRPPLRRDAHQSGGRRDDRNRQDRNNRDRAPKSFVAAPKEKEIKPISEKMKQGKEALRSFADLAQFLGHVQVTDPAEEKKRKKEENRKREETEKTSSENNKES